MLRAWNIEDLPQAIIESKSFKELLIKLNLKSKSSSSKTVKKYIKLFNLDTSHFISNEASLNIARSNNLKNILSHDEIFSNNTLSTAFVKKEFLKLVDYRCFICGIDNWLSNKLTLHIDHINGNNNDNKLDNLRLLCPNCHSQTDTYCGRNATKPIKQNNACANCGQTIYKTSTLCKSCASKQYNGNRNKFKIDWPEDDLLIAMIKSTNVLRVAKKLSVSYNAVIKRIKSRGLKIKGNNNEDNVEKRYAV